MLFKVKDYQGLTVILTKNTWYDKLLDPVYGHPEVKVFLPQIKKTIQFPEHVYQSKRDPRSKLFFTTIASGTFATYFLSVVVKYVQEFDQTVGYVSTVMINRKLPAFSQLIWQKKVLT